MAKCTGEVQVLLQDKFDFTIKMTTVPTQLWFLMVAGLS